jgi:hypothetical protein
MKDPELATPDMDIQGVFDLEDGTGAKPAGTLERQLIDPPPFIPKGSEKAKHKLYKNDDPEVLARYTGAQYEVHQYELWKEKDMAEYQDIMTQVGTDEFTAIIFQDRVFIKEKNSWKVLLELAHYVQVIK